MEARILDRSPYKIHLFQINADNTARIRLAIDDEDIRGRYKIGYWAWELPRFPLEWAGASDEVDEIWTPSSFVAHAVQQVTSKPVLVFAHPIPIASPNVKYDRRYFGIAEEAVVVLIAFDANSFSTRKNPIGALKAFRRGAKRAKCFSQIVIKFHGSVHDQHLRQLIADETEGLNALIIDQVLSRDEMTGLQNSCDVYLSLHRSEGFGLNIAECMELGKLVVATNFSGNVDFLDESCGAPVGFSMVPVKDGEYPFGGGQWWAEPDVDEAANFIRRAIDDRIWRTQLGLAASRRIHDQLSFEVIGGRMRARVDTLLLSF